MISATSLCPYSTEMNTGSFRMLTTHYLMLPFNLHSFCASFNPSLVRQWWREVAMQNQLVAQRNGCNSSWNSRNVMQMREPRDDSATSSFPHTLSHFYKVTLAASHCAIHNTGLTHLHNNSIPVRTNEDFSKRFYSILSHILS